MNMRTITRTLGTLAIAAALSLTLTAAANAGVQHRREDCPRGVPEIDLAAAGSVVSVVLGGLAIFADRRRKR
jgi:hypothetical protein